MAEKITIEHMKNLIRRLEDVRNLDEQIPQAYIDRLERATQLLGEMRNLPKVDWDNIATAEDIERAEGAIHRKLELKNDIEKHLHTCSLISPPMARGRAARKRQPRRSHEQIEYDRAVAEVMRNKKEELGLPARGRISADDQHKLDVEVEKELKRRKIAAPKG